MRLLKKVFTVVLLVFIPVGFALAQVDKGNKELSVSASLAHATVHEEYYGEKYKDSFTTLWLAGRLGFFLTKNFEIEPEIAIGKISEDLFDTENKLGYILSCNLAYNFTPDKKTVPFVLAGFGLSNTIPIYHNVMIWSWEDETYKLINAGAGIKVFLGKKFALRFEYRFQYYFDGQDEFNTTFTYHYGLIGVSLFLK